MNIKEIEISLSGVIPSGSYENLKPGYRMTIALNEGDNEKEAFNMANNYLHEMFELEVNRAKTDLIDKQYANIRFYEHEGKKYPSVTSILNWDKGLDNIDGIQQFASRGIIVHKIIERYLKTNKWENPEDIAELKEDVATVLGGSLGLHWDDCTHKEFFEAFGKDIEIDSTEISVINTEIGYGGTYDAIGKFKKRMAIFDWKTGKTNDFRQLSAYAMATAHTIETLVIAPVGVTDNKSGVMKPKVSESLNCEFKDFLKARATFKRRFGI